MILLCTMCILCLLNIHMDQIEHASSDSYIRSMCSAIHAMPNNMVLYQCIIINNSVFMILHMGNQNLELLICLCLT